MGGSLLPSIWLVDGLMVALGSHVVRNRLPSSWLSVGFGLALGGFALVHTFLALDPRLPALGFGKPFIFRVFGVFRGLPCLPLGTRCLPVLFDRKADLANRSQPGWIFSDAEKTVG